MNPSVILLGTKPGSIVVLTKMLELGWNIKHVVVPNNYSTDWIQGSNLEEFALSKNLNVLKSQNHIPKNETVDLVISYMYRDLVKDFVIKMAKIAAVNFHAGPLPEFGGWAFYNVAILENVKEYGCTCHYMDNGFDTGPLLKVNKFSIEAKEETAFSLERKTQANMIKLFNDFIRLIENDIPLPKIIQEVNKMRYLNRDEFNKLKRVPENADKETIDRYSRAFWYPPYDCAYIMMNGVKVELVPEIVKLEVAKKLHLDDLDMLFIALNKI